MLASCASIEAGRRSSVRIEGTDWRPYSAPARMKRVHERNLRAALLAALSAGVACFEVANPPVPVLLRAALAIPLLLAPGYALATALFPSRQLSPAEWWTVAAGLDLASVILTGLVLDATPGGLDRTGWSIALACVALGGAGVGFVSARGRGVVPWMARRRRIGGIVTGAIVLLGAFAALGVARQSAASHEHLSRFTELWALPSGGPQHAGTLRFGVKNDQGVVESYRVVAVSGTGDPLFRLSAFRLRSGQSRKWTRSLAGTRVHRVILRLYKASSPGRRPYRRVTVQIRR